MTDKNTDEKTKDLVVFLDGIGRTIIAERYPSILVSYWNQDSSFIENEFLDDYEAQVWQHEINHLDGKQEILKDLPIKKEERLPGRNEPCFCGSDKKFKKCCGK